MVISVKSFNTERSISNDNKMLNGLTLKWHVLKYEITELLILVPHKQDCTRELEADDACLWAALVWKIIDNDVN